MRIRNKLFSYPSLFLILTAMAGVGILFATSPLFSDAYSHHRIYASPTPGVPQLQATLQQPLATPGMTPLPQDVQPIGTGQAYYVAPTGNDQNDGTLMSPFATITMAEQVATPGSVVHVLPGTYTDNVVIVTSGTAAAPITFISDSPWGAQIKTTGKKDPWTTHADYINIIGFDITSSGSRDGITNLGSFIRTIGNHVHDIPGGCDSIGGAGIDDGNYAAHDDDIIGNVVNNIGSTYPQLCQYVHGIYHSTAKGTIQNNLSYDNAGNGINLWHAATATVVSNNLVFGNQEHGISIGTNTANTNGTIGDYFIVANNISIDNSLLGIRERKGVGPHNQYLNNIVYGNGDKPFGDEQYQWPSAVGSTDVNTITQGVQFVNFQLNGSGDYHLAAGSPAIGAGTSVGAPMTDFAGNPRPQGKPLDIGPYQYSG
jgi:pectate disaccharide-lyase